MSRHRPPTTGPDASDALDAAAGTPLPLSPADGPTLEPSAPAGRGPDLRPLYGAATAVLAWGFRLGALLLAAGLVLALIRREPLNRSADPFSEVLPTVRAGEAAGVVDLAIIWFMLTPVAVVAVVAVGFWRAGDRAYALLSLLVLAVLGTSIVLAV